MDLSSRLNTVLSVNSYHSLLFSSFFSLLFFFFRHVCIRFYIIYIHKVHCILGNRYHQYNMCVIINISGSTLWCEKNKNTQYDSYLMSNSLNIDLVTTIFCHMAMTRQQSKYIMFFKLLFNQYLIQ